MDLILDGNGPVYAQLTRALRGAITSGRLPHGSRLTPSRDLAHQLGLSRRTVVSAFDQLRAEGLLESRVGSGSFVHAPANQVKKTPASTRPIAAQSAYSRRARAIHDPANLPGRRVVGMRYAFDYGLPILDATLTTAWAREVARTTPYVRPTYPMPQGHPLLREAISAHIRRTRGVLCEPDDIVVTNGAQQAVSLMARVLVDEGDDVVVEEPQYFGTRRILQLHGARVLGVPVDAQGLRVDLLPQRAPKLVCLTPSHQFPTGVVLSTERRHALLDYARQHDGWILEDDYDGEFRQDARPMPAMQSLDREGRVLYVGSFSKTVFPALRLGYVIVPQGLRDDFLAAKWADDFGSSPLEQRALANMMRSGVYDRHVHVASRKLVELREVLVDGLRTRCGKQIVFTESHAGMHVLIHIPALSADAGEALIRLACERRLGLYSARDCYLQPPAHTVLMMGYGTMSARDIRDAVALFATCLKDALGGRMHGAPFRMASAG